MSKTIITIGREFGSGGREIGGLVADQLGIKLYDKELLDRASKESGICEELFESHDEKPTHSFLYSLVMDTYSMGYSTGLYNDMPINHKIFLAQFEAIKNIAKDGPCIIVGRCADYALEGNPDLLRIFIYGDMEDKIRRISGKYDLSYAKAKELIQKTNKKRAHYYNYYSNKRWGDIGSYDICLNSSVLGIEGTAKAIIDIVSLREMR